MNRRDRAAWRTARGLADLGELTAHWCEFQLQQTPYHCGPPDPETVPYLGTLAAVNRAGFVTVNSQAAGRREDTCDIYVWNAWVQGFYGMDDYLRVEWAVARAHLAMAHMPDEERSAVMGWYEHRCRAVADALADAVWVEVFDPMPGRNDRLWPALTALAAALGEEHTP